MSSPLSFLIVDGYDRDSRSHLEAAGMKLAADLYREMLLRLLPQAQCDSLFASDAEASLAQGAGLEQYSAILWTGCNATIYEDVPSVRRQIDLAKAAYGAGVPQFGSCWGLQMAAVAAGGEVAANPNGREMGIARRILLTAAGQNHPMMVGRSPCFEAFISHVDEVTQLPPGAQILAGNDFTRIQAIAVQHGEGIFWGVQYHPEYDLHEMARLTVAREAKLISLGFYEDSGSLHRHVGQMEALHADPSRRDLRWLLAIDDDVLDAGRRTVEMKNFLDQIVLPRASRKMMIPRC